MADFLFVQSAKGMTFDKASNTLTLKGVSPVTILFYRPAGTNCREHEYSSIHTILERGEGQLQVGPAQCRHFTRRGWQAHSSGRGAARPRIEGR